MVSEGVSDDVAGIGTVPFPAPFDDVAHLLVF